MAFNRLQFHINDRISMDQYIFRAKFSIIDSLFAVDTLLSKASEFNLPVWSATLELQKAFDRVEHNTIFEALRYFEVDDSMIALIQLMYSEQYGYMRKDLVFEISRGVRQGDVLSTLLFNATLDYAFFKWKRKFNSHRWNIDNSSEYLTNVRFADDILLMVKSKEELCEMMT